MGAVTVVAQTCLLCSMQGLFGMGCLDCFHNKSLIV